MPDDRPAQGQAARSWSVAPIRAAPRSTTSASAIAARTRSASTSSDLGVTHIEAKTRGALDATGTDEASWSQDRRVDLQVN